MVDVTPVPAVSTSEHLSDELVASVLKSKAPAPMNPHSQRLLAASLKPAKPALDKDQKKGTAAKTKVKKPAQMKKPAHAGSLKSTRDKAESSQPSHGMSSKEISTYYSSTKKWFFDRWDWFSTFCFCLLLSLNCFVLYVYFFAVISFCQFGVVWTWTDGKVEGSKARRMQHMFTHVSLFDF